MAAALYLDTSAILRATLEGGKTPEIEDRIRSADALVTSRLTLVEAARAFLRLRAQAVVAEEQLMLAERNVDALLARCDLWELTPAVCDAARIVAPRKLVRALGALHLATFFAARRRIEGLVLLTADQRLREAAEGA